MAGGSHHGDAGSHHSDARTTSIATPSSATANPSTSTAGAGVHPRRYESMDSSKRVNDLEDSGIAAGVPTVHHRARETAWAEVDRCHEYAGRMLWRLGAALNEAKNVTPHGQWAAELERRSIKERSAQQYMQVARDLTEAEFIEAGSFRKAIAAAANTKRVSYSADDTAAAIDAAVSAGHLTADLGSDLSARVEAGTVSAERVPRILQEAAARSSGRVRHPAKFSPEIVAALTERLPAVMPPPARILDPFAGVGGIHKLAAVGYETVGVEIEPEWAGEHPDTICGDSRTIPLDANTVDAVVTSPTYGNKMARKSPAHPLGGPVYDYATQLGRSPTVGSTALHHFGDDYRLLHETVWTECRRVLTRRGELWLNTRDPIQDGEAVPVTAWHLTTLLTLGFALDGCHVVTTPGMLGSPHRDRQQGETIWRLIAPQVPRRSKAAQRCAP